VPCSAASRISTRAAQSRIVGDRGALDEQRQPIGVGGHRVIELARGGGSKRRPEGVSQFRAISRAETAQQQHQRERTDRVAARQRVENARDQPLDGALLPAWSAIIQQACNYNEGMSAIRFVALLALVVWLGGMIVLGLVVAPATFRVLQAQAPATGRVLAGALFGDILRRFYLLAYGCGAVMLLSLLMMKSIGPPPRAFLPRAAIVVTMLAVAAYAGVPVAREIAQLQSRVSGPINALPETDPLRLRFDTLHAMSTRLMTVDIVLGLVLLSWYIRE
jgi:hypothetical protein